MDDNAIVRISLERCLAAEPDMLVLRGLSSADLMLTEWHNAHPDVVILDLTMEGKRPLDALRELNFAQASARTFPGELRHNARVIIYSGHNDRRARDEAADAGAWGFLCKDEDIPTVLLAIRTVARGGVWFNTRRTG